MGSVIGMILGDGTLARGVGHKGTKKENHSPIMQITHSINNRDYLAWKVDILSNLTGVKTREYEAVTPQGLIKKYIRLYTKSHPMYLQLYDRFYGLGKKEVDDFLLNSLTNKGLAIWYMDDGSLHVKARFLKLSTCSFCYASHQLMSKWLFKKWGVHTAIWKHGNYYVLGIKANSREKFINVISEFVNQVPSMKYKIDVTPVRSYLRTLDAHFEQRHSLTPGVTQGVA